MERREFCARRWTEAKNREGYRKWAAGLENDTQAFNVWLWDLEVIRRRCDAPGERCLLKPIQSEAMRRHTSSQNGWGLQITNPVWYKIGGLQMDLVDYHGLFLGSKIRKYWLKCRGSGSSIQNDLELWRRNTSSQDDRELKIRSPVSHETGGLKSTRTRFMVCLWGSKIGVVRAECP